MADIVTPSKRSYIMSKVSRHDTPQETSVRKYLFKNGFRFRKNYRQLPGSPDIVLVKYKVAIFVNGCFWHGHHCRAASRPKSNTVYWNSKIESNKERDKRKSKELRTLGWRVIVIWQCDLSKKKLELTLKKLVKTIQE